MKREIIIKDTHRGLRYEDGVMTGILEAGRHLIPREIALGFYRTPKVEITLVDVRERDLTIKGQEILTADKVAIRVSIIVQFRVTDPRAAMHEVADYEDRLYTDVQLAARRSPASMPLEYVMTNDTRLDEARTKAETQRIDAQVRADGHRAEAEAQAAASKLAAQAEAEAIRVKTEAEVNALREREQAAEAYSAHPVLLRLQELETLRELARTANARIYIGFDKHRAPEPGARDAE